MGVFLAYVGPRGQALYDRAHSLPRAWADDPARRARAWVPGAVGFATKPQLAQGMVLRALDSALPVAWVAGDEVYGDYPLRATLEARRQPYALAVKSTHAPWAGVRQRPARDLVAAAPAAWARLSCGDGSKGPRLYDWLSLPITHAFGARWERWLVARRSLIAPEDPRSVAYFLAFAPAATSLGTLVG